MKCPYCYSEKTRVIDKREIKKGSVVRRRRECKDCSKRFTTYERMENSLIIVKKDGSKENFNKTKLMNGIMKSCEKRDISKIQVKKLVNEIERLLKKNYSKEVESKEIGKLVSEKLKKLDTVAYMRFASVYKDFDDVNSFKKELDLLSEKKS